MYFSHASQGVCVFPLCNHSPNVISCAFMASDLGLLQNGCLLLQIF